MASLPLQSERRPRTSLNIQTFAKQKFIFCMVDWRRQKYTVFILYAGEEMNLQVISFCLHSRCIPGFFFFVKVSDS